MDEINYGGNVVSRDVLNIKTKGMIQLGKFVLYQFTDNIVEINNYIYNLIS